MNIFTKIVLAGILIWPQTAWAQPMKGAQQEPGREGKKEFHQRHGKKMNKNHSPHWKEWKEKKHAFESERRKEHQAFFESLKTIDPSQKPAAIKSHFEAQHAKRIEFQDSWHNEKMTSLEGTLTADPGMSDEKKHALLKKWESKFEDKKTAREQRHQKRMALITEILSDETLSDDEKTERIQTKCSEYKKEWKENMPWEHKKSTKPRGEWKKSGPEFEKQEK